MMRGEDIKVVCRKCGRKALSSSMKLDLDEKMMICPDCIKSKGVRKEIKETIYEKNKAESKEKEEVYEEEKPTRPVMPVDLNIENVAKEVPKKVGHKCRSCGYTFRINMEKKTPNSCPYCNTKVFFNF